MSLINYFKSILSCDVAVLYAGKKTTVIGPPRSMANLADLLEPHYSTFRSKNIFFDRNIIHSDVINSKPFDNTGNEHPISLKSKLEVVMKKFKMKLKKINILHQSFIFFTLMRFNFLIYFILLVNQRAKIIITQPFVLKLPFCNIGHRLIYIRRANVDWGVRQLVNDNFNVKSFFDGSFFAFSNVKLVYLVDLGTLSKKYSVIPNHFNADDFTQVTSESSELKILFVGTWSSRKGGNLLITLSNNIYSFLAHKIEVYGALGAEPDLNTSLISAEGISYCGVVEKPYSKMKKGDIFISLSLVEGLQRSLIEAMLSGCIIVAFNRPDSHSVKECKGVFIVDEFDSSVFEKCIKSILDIPKKERELLGDECVAFAKNRYSAPSVLSKWKVILDA
jgi:glycosyltransferase involved in cell wall biosynthesis